jgi:TorA maturation chaperone TorD
MGNTEKAQRTAVARQRSNIYGLLASVYRQEVNADLLHQVKDPQFLGVLSDLGIQLTSDFLQKPEEELLDDLAVEFAGLFLGPGGHISPHESVHHQRDGVESGMLWGEATVEVKKFIESAGLDYDPEYTGLPDHISVELEFMEALARHEEQAWSEDDDEEAFRCLDMERRFLDEHLSRWVPAFCDKVMAAAELPFYREMAALTKNFIEFEREEVEGYAGDLK